jgi:hypothetical protein
MSFERSAQFLTGHLGFSKKLYLPMSSLTSKKARSAGYGSDLDYFEHGITLTRTR